ncbi:hypothetical protein DPMN_109678 [Dreissena polymorpha]|uniref:Uncharacterized protein n=1 Tax=Dreissena polymorpha TaxID=45954 RepID=A0A9D4QM84_DREPO|nr:hypothetical protein DPMN_109678 [Dreissena polymorpha]
MFKLNECALKSILSDNVCNVQSLEFSICSDSDIDFYEILSSSAHCIKCLTIENDDFYETTDYMYYFELGLSRLIHLQELSVRDCMELVPLCGFTEMTLLSLNCKCKGLDLSFFSKSA